MHWRSTLLTLALVPHIASGSAASSGRQILRESLRASGGSAWNSIATLKMTGAVSFGRMSGRIVLYQDLTDGKFHNNLAVGPFTEQTGFNGKTGWTLDSNGDVALHDSPFEQRSDRTQAYLAARDYWFPRRWPAVITDAGTVARGPIRYEVVRIAPRSADPFQLWIDAATHRIGRVILGGKFRTETVEYGDYRRVHGLVLPFRIAVAAAHSGGTQTIRLSQVVVNEPVPAQLYDAPQQQLTDYSFAANAHSATIPFRYIGNHIYFAAEIRGHTFQFGLDTGAMNIITPRVAKAIGVPTEGSAQATGVGRKRTRVRFAKIPAISLDSKLTLRNQLFVVIPLSGISAIEGTALDGVLGYELFKRFVIRIDYANQRLQILRPTHLDVRSAGTPVPFTYDGRMPQVGGALDGLPGRFDVDTGSRDDLSINSPFVKRHRLVQLYDATARTVVGWGAGGAAYGRLARARDFRVGDVAVRCPVLELSTGAKGTDAERSVAGVIGNGILSRFTVTFDYAKQIVYLRPNSRYGSAFGYDRAGMWVNRMNHAFIVKTVMPGGPAQRAGLGDGDLITAVDGKESSDIELADLRRMLENSPVGTTVHLRVIRGNRAFPVTVTLRNLIPQCAQ